MINQSQQSERLIQNPINIHNLIPNAPNLDTLNKINVLFQKTYGSEKHQNLSMLIIATYAFAIGSFITGIFIFNRRLTFFFSQSVECDYNYYSNYNCLENLCQADSSQWQSKIYWHANSIIYQTSPYLICHNSSTMIKYIFYIGSFFGFFIVPFLADNLGRKNALRFSLGTFALGLVLLFISTFQVLITIGSFISGIGSYPALFLCFTFIFQQNSLKKRQQYLILLLLITSVGAIFISGIFLTGWTWRVNIVFLLIFLCIGAGFFFYLQQSPILLFLINKRLEVKDVVSKIAKRNISISWNFTPQQILQIQQIQNCPSRNCSKRQNVSLLTLFKNKSLRKITFCVGIAFFGVQTAYYLVQYLFDNVGYRYDGNIYFMCLGALEIFGFLIGMCVIKKLNRRIFLFAISILMSVASLIVAVVSRNGNFDLASVIGSGLTRIGLALFWSMLFVYVGELYPTEVRTIAYGWVGAIGMLSRIITYAVMSSIIGLDSYYNWGSVLYAWIYVGIIGFVASFLLLLLPQTYGQKLKDLTSEYA